MSRGNSGTAAEFVVVMGLAFGLSLLSSFLSLTALLTEGTPPELALSDEGLYALIAYEILAFGIIALFLRWRGWSLVHFDLHMTPRLTAAGFGLFAFYYFVYVLGYSLMDATFPSLLPSEDELAARAEPIGLLPAVLVSVVNPVFEEVLVVGYVVAALEKRKGIWFAVNTSVLIRFLYHLYQGPVAVVAILPLGWILAVYYVRARKLWPLVVCHGLLDLIALLAYGR